MKVWAAVLQQVEIDPLNIIKELNVLPDGGEFVRIENGYPTLYAEEEIRILTPEEYEVYKAKETLIKFLESKSKR